jgi:hypothetical protein
MGSSKLKTFEANVHFDGVFLFEVVSQELASPQDGPKLNRKSSVHEFFELFLSMT